jgi:hypothetical protein
VFLFHGTHVDFAIAFEVGSPLDVAIAAEHHIDGEPGFYLATDEGDAEFFAARRWLGRVVAFEASDTAMQRLKQDGALSRPIPGGRPPYFTESELFVPVAAFPNLQQACRGR